MKRLIGLTAGVFLMMMSFQASARADLKDMYMGSVFALVQNFAANMQSGCNHGEAKNGCINNAPVVKKAKETSEKKYDLLKKMNSEPGAHFSIVFNNIVTDIVNSYNQNYDVDLDPNDPFWLK